MLNTRRRRTLACAGVTAALCAVVAPQALAGPLNAGGSVDLLTESNVRIGNLPGYDARGLETAFTVSAAQKVIAQRAAIAPENTFITALAGLARRQFNERRFPTMAELDDAAPRLAGGICRRFGSSGQT